MNATYKGFNISLDGVSLKATNNKLTLTGRWQQIKKAIDKIIQ